MWKRAPFSNENICCLKRSWLEFRCLFVWMMQSRRVSTTTTSTTRNASAVTPAVSTWRAPVRSAPVASRIKSFATSILPTWLSWSRPTSCSNWGASSRNRSAVPSHDARAARRSFSRSRLRPVQVFFSYFPPFFVLQFLKRNWLRSEVSEILVCSMSINLLMVSKPRGQYVPVYS